MAAASSTLAARPADAVAAAPADACHHCGERLPAHALERHVDGASHAFCCEGCAAAAQWIGDAGLADYYRLRSDWGSRVAQDAIDLGAWDREDVLAEHARAVPGGREITLLADGMRCAACAWLVDRVLSREPGVLEAGANAVTGRIHLTWDPARTPLSRPLARLVALGYRPFLATGAARERALRRERNHALLRLGVAGLGAMQAMMFAEALYLDTTGSMPLPTRDALRWITFLVSTPVVFFAGWPFLAGAWRQLRHRRLGMDVLVAGSTLLAWAASVAETVRGGAHVWYDAAVMFVFLLLAARQLEQRARRLASAQVDALAHARPAFAARERDDGTRETVPVAALAVGDVACVAAGEPVPADGILLDPAASVEEALLTGESRPVAKAAGMRLYAGSVCRERPLRLRVGAVGAATRVSQLARLVEQAQAHRPAIARLADRVASRFVAVLLVIAVLVFAAWRVHDPARAFEVTLALLVVSCPCALSLAVPAALACAHGALARMGLLALGADALDRLARVTDVVLDKTGTLGERRPALRETRVFDGFDPARALALAAALERDSRHPLAAAFAGMAEAPRAEAAVAVPGAGIEGRVDGACWRLGHAPFASGGIDDGGLWLGDGRRAVARFEIGETARGDAEATVAALRAQGLALHVASGDAADRVTALAATLGIDAVRSRQTPEDKLAYLRALQAEGRVVAMVGDGINDAPVLAGADVAIAIGDGAALAHRSADLVLTGALHRIPQAVALARRLRRVVRQNLAWAIAYNLLALPLAAAGLVTPWLAALGMALSSLTVTANALRLARGVRP